MSGAYITIIVFSFLRVNVDRLFDKSLQNDESKLYDFLWTQNGGGTPTNY